jgi:cytochrome c-type biogenesis protein CcmH
MIGFILVSLLLLALGVAVLAWPLLRGPRAAPEPKADAIIGLFREKLRDLEAEHAGGGMAAAQYEQSRRELERQLLEAVAVRPAAAPPAGPAPARWSAVLVGSFVLVAPIVLYVFLGAPAALVPGAIAPADGGGGAGGEAAAEGKTRAGPLTNAQVQKMIDSLVEALKKSPGDAQGWTMLARAYSYEHQYPESVRAFTRAVALNPKDARLLADMADAMAMANGQNLDGEPLKLLERALQIDPRDLKALALAGTAAFDHQQYDKAIDYWERALKVAPNDPEFARGLRSSLDEARKLAGRPAAAPSLADSGAAPAVDPSPRPAAGGAGGVRGRVTLAAGLAAKAQPGDTIFVFARAAQGPKMPLALLRRQVKDLPFEFTLDDSMAMMPDFTLSKYAPVIIGARVSRSGDAIASAGDLQGFSKPVAAGSAGVNVTIDQVVQ